MIGPRLIGRAGAIAESLGANELVGPFVMAAVGFTVAAVYYATTLRPDPTELAIAQSGVTSFVERRPLRELIGVPAIQLALVTMMASQFVMVFVMVIAPVHMRANGHSLDVIGWVMTAHTLGMFGVAPITGTAIRRWGTHRVVTGAAVTLASATLVAMSPPTADMKTFVVALFLLGLGWNLGVVAGSTIIQEELMLQDRVGIQGIGDTLTALAAASGAFATGFVADWWGFRGVSAIGLVMSVVPLIALARHAKRSIDRVDHPDRSRSG